MCQRGAGRNEEMSFGPGGGFRKYHRVVGFSGLVLTNSIFPWCSSVAGVSGCCGGRFRCPGWGCPPVRGRKRGC